MSGRWLRIGSAGELTIAVHAQPGVRRTEIAGEHGDALKVRLAAPPVDGKANECLVKFFAALLGVNRADVELVSGASGRSKVLRVRGASAAGVEALRDSAAAAGR